MFEYFPGNYVWNLGVVATLNAGGTIDEVDRACRPLKDLASQGSDVGTADFMTAWRNVADQLEAQADEALKAGHLRTAGQKYFRASVYVSQAERMQSAKDPGRNAEYERSVELLVRSFEFNDPAHHEGRHPVRRRRRCRRTSTMPRPTATPTPVMIVWNGLDSTKEMMVGCGIHHELAARGISTLMVDCPGSGEALRLHGLTAQVDTEVWAAACVDWLEDSRWGAHRPHRSRGLVPRWLLRPAGPPPSRSGSHSCVAWGANHDWGAVQKRRLDREGENPVPHYWDHVLWVWGQPDIDTFIDFAEDVNLDGVVEQITVPFLIAHGRTTDRSRSSTPTGPTTRPSTARSASSGSSRPRRGRPSTSGSTTSRTSSATSPTG